MGFRGKPLAALVAASLIVLGCVGAPDTTSTEGPQFAVTQTALSCTKALADEIAAEIDQISSQSTRSQLKNQWGKAVKACPDLAAAGAEQKKYIQLTIDKFYAGALLDPNGSSAPTREEFLVAHWDKTALFVAEAEYDLAASVLGTSGGVMVIGPQGADLINGNQTAGIRVNPNAISNSHVFSIAPVADCSNVASFTNLDLYPLCFDFQVDPVVSFVSPWVHLSACAAENSPGALLGRGVLASNHANTVKIAAKAADPLSLNCENALVDANQPEPRGFFGAVSRLASAALGWLAPTRAVAIHAATSGRPVGELSIWGTADPVVFLSTLTGNTVGLPPGPPEKGTWTILSEDPGSVLVGASLGDISSNLLVINQQGGACATCGGLTLTATVKGNPPGTPADNGVYLARWRSVISSPNVGYVPFILRGSTGELGRLEYRAGSSAQSGPITFNGTIAAGTWNRNVSQLFELTLDLINNTVSLSINGVPVAGVQGIAFVSSASDLATVSIEIVGNDVQTVGLDDLEIRRQPDYPAGFTP